MPARTIAAVHISSYVLREVSVVGECAFDQAGFRPVVRYVCHAGGNARRAYVRRGVRGVVARDAGPHAPVRHIAVARPADRFEPDAVARLTRIFRDQAGG